MHIVLNLGGAQGDENVIMAMMMHQGRGMRRDLHLKHPYEWILQREMMRRFGCDLDFRCLRAQENNGTDN